MQSEYTTPTPCKDKNALASLLFACMVLHMDKLINIRVSAEDYELWQAALKKEGRTVSSVVRAALERIAKRVEKESQ